MIAIRPHASLDDVARSLIVLSGLVACFGALVIIGPGFNNPLRFGPWIVAFGLIAFFVPGLLGIVAGLYIKRRATWAWPLGVASSALQSAVALVGVVGQFYLTPISLVPLLACAAWAVVAGVLVFELVRFRHAMRTDVVIGAHGFDVQPLDHSDSVRLPK